VEEKATRAAVELIIVSLPQRPPKPQKFPPLKKRVGKIEFE
jgi:hypothetical protein